MTNTCGILSEYIEAAMNTAEYEQFEDDGSYGGRVKACLGVCALKPTLRECERELRSVLEDWVFVGLKLGHELPVIDGIDLNKDVTRPVGIGVESRPTAESSKREPLWERAAELRESIPEEEWAKLPADGAEQIDHYIYGTPKRSVGERR